MHIIIASIEVSVRTWISNADRRTNNKIIRLIFCENYSLCIFFSNCDIVLSSVSCASSHICLQVLCSVLNHCQRQNPCGINICFKAVCRTLLSCICKICIRRFVSDGFSVGYIWNTINIHCRSFRMEHPSLHRIVWTNTFFHRNISFFFSRKHGPMMQPAIVFCISLFFVIKSHVHDSTIDFSCRLISRHSFNCSNFLVSIIIEDPVHFNRAECFESSNLVFSSCRICGRCAGKTRQSI